MYLTVPQSKWFKDRITSSLNHPSPLSLCTSLLPSGRMYAARVASLRRLVEEDPAVAGGHSLLCEVKLLSGQTLCLI